MLHTEVLCQWPINYLQDNLLGICTGDLVVIACDSGVGKSTISRMLTRTARQQECPVVLYGLENRRDTFITEEVMREYFHDNNVSTEMRAFEIAHTANADKYKKYRQRVYEQSQMKDKNGLLLQVVHEQVAKGDWNTARLISSMKSEIRKGYRFFIIDHLDVLIARDEYKDIQEVMNELWALVDEYNIAVVGFSQVIKSMNPPLVPALDDLRGPKTKVFKATIVITLAKHEYGYYRPPIKYPNALPTYIRIAKSRSSKTSCAVCYYNDGDYLETYTPVICDAPGRYIDGMTREKLQKYKAKQTEKKAEQW